MPIIDETKQSVRRFKTYAEHPSTVPVEPAAVVCTEPSVKMIEAPGPSCILPCCVCAAQEKAVTRIAKISFFIIFPLSLRSDNLRI